MCYFVAPFIQSCLKTEVAAQSSLQCSVSLTGPVVNTTHAEDQPSASFVSSSTNCVPTSKDHHVHICTSNKVPYVGKFLRGKILANRLT